MDESKMTYILIDTANMFFRARHVARGSVDMKIGLCYHIMFNSIKKAFNDFGNGHVVFCLEGRSWRRSVYEPYKKNRDANREALTLKEQEEDEMFWEAYQELLDYLNTKTNCSVLQEENSEADDLIARWIHNHQGDDHVIVSSDSDFYQLINDNVSMYNGITNQHITINGIYDDKGAIVMDKKTNAPKTIPLPAYALFEKCVRGDTSDNIFSAYPGARKKGSKNKTGIQEAFDDRDNQGFAWNNFMLQKWTDHNDIEHVVRDDYERNRILIDLTLQPDEIKKACDSKIVEAVQKEITPQVGIHFMKFCGKHDLQRMSDQAQDYAAFLNKVY
jgi:5'-3' exonuclease